MLKDTLNDAIKSAMKARDLEQVKVLRNVQAAIKKIEIDEQTELDDAGVLAVLEKQIKQRQESHAIFVRNGREDLAQKEQFEMDVIAQFMPKPLNDDEIAAIVTHAITETGASSIKDMGKVMALIKPQIVGRADPAAVSAKIKARLA